MLQELEEQLSLALWPSRDRPFAAAEAALAGPVEETLLHPIGDQPGRHRCAVSGRIGHQIACGVRPLRIEGHIYILHRIGGTVNGETSCLHEIMVAHGNFIFHRFRPAFAGSTDRV